MDVVFFLRVSFDLGSPRRKRRSLTNRIFRNPSLAWWSALAFAWGPHSVFLSAAYTEGVFALLCFSGLHQLFSSCSPSPSSLDNVSTSENRKGFWRQSCHLILASLCLSACTLVRSNGNLLAMFPLAFLLRRAMSSCAKQQGPMRLQPRALVVESVGLVLCTISIGGWNG